jgi:hypothetical protein
MHGKKLGRGEETEFFARRQLAPKASMSEARSVTIRLKRIRSRFRALYRYGVASGRASRAIVNPRESGSRLKGATFLARGMLQLLKDAGTASINA